MTDLQGQLSALEDDPGDQYHKLMDTVHHFLLKEKLYGSLVMIIVIAALAVQLIRIKH